MNILHVTTFLHGGAGKIILNLALSQCRAGHSATIVMNKTSEPGYFSYPEYIEILKKHGVHFLEVDSTFKRDLYLNFNAVVETRKLLETFSIDIIHAHAAIPALIGLIARSGNKKSIPVIQTMHGWGLNKNRLQEEMDVTIMNSLDKVVAVALSDQHLLENKGVQRERLTTLYNGIETPLQHYPSDSIFEELQNFKSKGYKIIGCIGTVNERKNQSLLVKAFKNIKTPFIGVFIGEGEMIPELKAKAKNEGIEEKVKFYGYQENATKYLKMFDCLVLPSKSEGLPLIVLESFAMKVPVLTSNIPIFQELIEDGRTGYLFESENALSLSAKLEEILSTPKSAFSPILEAAYQKFEHLFTLEAMIKNYHDLYRSLI